MKDKYIKVSEGVVPLSSINPNIQKRQRGKRVLHDTETYVQGVLSGDRILLSQAITLLESQKTAHQGMAQAILDACLPHSGKSVRIGITGTPGVGKSSFIEAFGLSLIEQGHKIAILAIDPTSQRSRGSILGDKTRMPELSKHDAAFIRPSAAGKSLGGVARKTRETTLFCEAAGYDIILIETVGVGQSEIAVHSMVDFFLLLLLPGAGDELQGIKRGIVEMADLIAINKADGDRVKLAKQAKRAYQNALHLFPPKSSEWTPQVLTCSALKGEGITDIWRSITEYSELTKKNGYFQGNRKEQAYYWLQEGISQQLIQLFQAHPKVKEALSEMEASVRAGTLSPYRAVEELMSLFQNKK